MSGKYHVYEKLGHILGHSDDAILRYYTANLQVVGSNPIRTCACGIYISRQTPLTRHGFNFIWSFPNQIYQFQIYQFQFHFLK